MRVLITGGSGLIGRAVAAPLAAQGYDVVVLSRDPARVRGLPPGARAARWDGRTAAEWEALLESGAAVLNLAGEGIAAGRWSEERKRRIRDSRVDAGRAVVEAVRLAVVDGLLDRAVESRRVGGMNAQQHVGEIGLLRAGRQAEDPEVSSDHHMRSASRSNSQFPMRPRFDFLEMKLALGKLGFDCQAKLSFAKQAGSQPD